MNQEIIIVTSAWHTGTWFTLGLLSQHSQISNPVTPKEIHREGLSVVSANRKTWRVVLLEDLKQEILNLRPDPRYVLLFDHINSSWLYPLLLYKPFDFKLIAPLRHPFSMMRSCILGHGPPAIEVFSYYMVLLQLVKNEPQKAIIPVDLWGKIPFEERMEKVQETFRYVELELEEKIINFIREWPIVNASAHKRELTSKEHNEIMERIRLSKVIPMLNDFGFPYNVNPN